MLSRRASSIGDYNISDRCPSLTTVIVIALLFHGSFGQDIAFPKHNSTTVRTQIHSTNETIASAKNRTSSMTVSTPIKCKENMVLVKFNETEIYCECLQGYMYHLETDYCYKSYTRGPCEDGSHFILSANKTTAECVRNPCKTDDEVLYKGSCHGLLLSNGPCPPYETLVISDTSHEPICRLIHTVLYNFIIVPLLPCAPGSRRDAEDKCREAL